MDDRRKWWMLGALLTVFAVLVAVRVISVPEPQRAPLKFKSGQLATATVTADTTGIPRIVRPAQMKPQDTPVLRRTNIFAPLGVDREERAEPKVRVARSSKGRAFVPRAVVTGEVFGPERPAPVVAPAVPTPPAPSPEEIAVQQARQQREAAAQQARQRLAQYRFLGYLTEGGEHRAFIGKGRELYIVRIGETVEGRIRVSSIDPSAVKLTDGETGVGTTLPLVKEAPPNS